MENPNGPRRNTFASWNKVYDIKYKHARPSFWNNKWHSWNFYEHHANRSHITSSLLYPTIKNTYMMTIKVSQIGETQAPVNERLKFYVVINV